MENTDVLIIGAGASGLMAAYQLSKAGKKVVVLEARNRTGGRIHTLDDSSFFKLAELGAEFVHGDLPVTLDLLKEAAIEVQSADAEMWHYQDGDFKKNGQFIDKWDEFIKKLNELKHDVPMNDFLQQEFPGDDYQELRESVWNYVSGYDTADPLKSSAYASRKEWENEDEHAQHRVAGGYCAMIGYLSTKCKKNGGQVFLNAIVKEINWSANQVKVITADQSTYSAKQIVIALPLGILQASDEEQAAIRFTPAIADHRHAIRQMGFGAVIKILLEFDEPFWDDKQHTNGKDLGTMGYLFSAEEIPTWWTQTPNPSSVITGWIGGPAAYGKLHLTDQEILRQSLTSVAHIFNFDADELKHKLIASKVVNWTADPFTLGSYAYDTVAAPSARKILNTPVQDTIYFTGEYLYEGTAMGTVEAALTSGRDVAKLMIG